MLCGTPTNPLKQSVAQVRWRQAISAAIKGGTLHSYIPIPMLQSDSDYRAFYQSTQHHIVVISKACGNVTMASRAWSSVRNPLFSRVRSLSHASTRSFFSSLNHPLSRPLSLHSFNCRVIHFLLTRSLIRWLTHLITHSQTHSFTVAFSLILMSSRAQRQKQL